jgi:hypothetical protein
MKSIWIDAKFYTKMEDTISLYFKTRVRFLDLIAKAKINLLYIKARRPLDAKRLVINKLPEPETDWSNYRIYLLMTWPDSQPFKLVHHPTYSTDDPTRLSSWPNVRLIA